MESNVLGFDLAFFYVDLVSAKNDRDVFANTDKIAMPVWHVLVGNSASDVKHDDGALSLDVVTIAKTTEFFLAGCIPAVEDDCSKIGVESERVNFDTEGGCENETSKRPCNIAIKRCD